MLSCQPEMFSRHHRRARVLFGLSDIALTALAFEAAYQTRVWLYTQPWAELERVFYILLPTKALMLGFSLFSSVMAALWLNVYERLDAADPRVILRVTSQQCAWAAVAVVLFQYSLRLDLSRIFLCLFGLYSWSLLLLFRFTAGRLVGIIRREFGAPHFVMVVGSDERARRLGEALERSFVYGVRLSGFLAMKPEESPREIELGKRYQVYPLDELPLLLRSDVIDEVIFVVGSESLAALEDVFLLCDEEGVRTRVAVDFFPHANSDIYLERLGFTPLLTFSAAPHDEIRLLAKRAIDVVLSAAALVLLFPLMLAIALLVKLTSPGPVIFRQVRCGLNGRNFVFYKFRSMVENAEELKEKLLHLNQRGTVFKLPNDPRVTPVGAFLRKFSIDEWPQLWNVLKGDMSLVGPRPAVPDEVARYQRWQRRRLRMRPGLTCLWALAGRDEVDFETWMKLDMQYIDNWSLALDWKILLLTIPRVLIGKGAN